MKQRKEQGMGVGTASVLMIVMVLAFTTFGILSFVSARADCEMARKAAALSEAWYAAEGRMQEQLARLDEQLAAGEDVLAETGRQADEAQMQAEDALLELVEPVRDGQELQVDLRLAANGTGYEIIRYELVNTGEWNPDNGLNIWDGGE